MHPPVDTHIIIILTFISWHVLYVKSEREKLQQKMKTKSGAEPKLVLLLDADDDPVSIFVVGDAMTLCEVPNADIGSALLALLASYFMLNLDYPDQYAQLVGLIQHHCLLVHFPENKRKTGFHHVSQLL